MLFIIKAVTHDTFLTELLHMLVSWSTLDCPLPVRVNMPSV